MTWVIVVALAVMTVPVYAPALAVVVADVAHYLAHRRSS